VVVGFAAESDDLLNYARAKMERKGLDLLVANDITATDSGFDVDTNRVVVMEPGGSYVQLDLMSKEKVSEYVVHRVAQLLTSQR
jgi:phosphopantothenoylcysteine decarboxylase/phosphopantothenate--cysteine ligase